MLGILRRRRKVLVIGLDCAAPQLVFEAWRDHLPHLRALIEGGLYGQLTSTIPAITVPAWSSMLSSRDPGVLGFYGFRNRPDRSYNRMTIATGAAVREKRVWDYVGEAGRPVLVMGVPQTYPVRPVNGHLVSCFLTPSTQHPYTHPHDLRHEIDRVLDGEQYEVDVGEFRTENKDALLEQLYAVSRKQVRVMRHLLETKPWDFAMFVDMGVDRIQHAFWKCHDPGHPRHEPGNPYQHAIRDYYVYLDGQIGTLLDAVPRDTLALVVSDHGAKGMTGGICINEWLRRQEYLHLAVAPEAEGLIDLERMPVDWAHTRAWSSGGYYARIFINVAGREPQGVVPAAEYHAFRDRLAAEIAAIPSPDGADIGTRVFRPEEIYQETRNVPPDLIVYFGDLTWRAVGTLGHGDVYTFENDIGPDDANHAEEGMFILYDPRGRAHGQRLPPRHLMDIAPTVLQALGLPIPPAMQGSVITAP